jgi:hypothetical protein
MERELVRSTVLSLDYRQNVTTHSLLGIDIIKADAGEGRQR